ncbi:GDYXXLXY domain-containing protein [Psychrobacter sp. I-STPA6b]|uniref:GDYXXLXY domain-containing protein n=1 Tax=Psychrobacter sp. I-STPA6b TaxID=2585718 RepID=UPI001D0C86AB|nr:GDYXXLXY domain-containing protein [Psychrobacter sp. I-STPA6b]
MIHPKITSKEKIRKNLPTGLPTLSSWRQRPTLKISLAVVALVIVLAIVNININKYEQHLADGDTVLLSLAPVDPRSLMQGDYMRLRFAIADDIERVFEKQDKDLYQPSEGWVVVRKDKHSVGQFVRLVDNPNTNLAPNEMAIYYRIRGGQVKFATNAFFFQEGQGSQYENSEYGVLKVNDKGEPLLAGLADKDFVVIGE